MAFQSLNGEMYDQENGFQESSNQSFTSVIKLKNPLAKFKKQHGFISKEMFLIHLILNIQNPQLLGTTLD